MLLISGALSAATVVIAPLALISALVVAIRRAVGRAPPQPVSCPKSEIVRQRWGPGSFYDAVVGSVPDAFGPSPSERSARRAVAEELASDDSSVRKMYRSSGASDGPQTYAEYRSAYLESVRSGAPAGSADVSAMKRLLARRNVVLVIISPGTCPGIEAAEGPVRELGGLAVPGEPIRIAFVTHRMGHYDYIRYIY